ncbi:MAG: glycosyltransferase family A protein [Bacteroidales bacterium]|nr:glycosyltransferase family A protein [Bacteroidales bacterium]MDD4641501.1 glycosyltransferase family A protein [Bacteroidales bacterium]
MKWYDTYLSVFEKPFEEVPGEIIERVSKKLHSMQSAEPVVSVVVIAHNEASRLFGCLWSLSENITNYPIEIIGVDNHSTDNTAEVYKASGIPWYYEENQSCGYARNRGRMYAKGKYYICIDSDTLYPPAYIQILTDRLERPGIVAVSSLWSFLPDKRFPTWQLKLYEFLRDIHLWLLAFKRPEMSVRGMVFAYNLEYGRTIDYRVDIIRGEDGMMALGLKKYGKISFIRNRKARALTSNAMLYSDGGIGSAFKKRILRSFKHWQGYFVKKASYDDQESNMIKK